MTIRDICAEFNIDGKYVSCQELTTGNINNTYQVKFIRDGQEKKYIIQRINKNVFKQPENVMENIVKVTHHIRYKIREQELSTRKFVMRAFYSKNSNQPFVIDDVGEYWRCYRFIENSTTYDFVDDLNIIEKAGTAFGKFQNYLSDFDAKELHETIPNFHNTKIRYKVFHETIEKDAYKRVGKVKLEIEKLCEFEKEAVKLQEYLDSGKIPFRVAHNDTKCNNVSFDKTTGEALAVLDLDTVMPGAIAHDFGDAIRFVANTCLEDDPDFESVALNLEKYEAFTKGFVSELKSTITDLEKSTLNLGLFTMTVELAVRFLTDYLNGDKYFKTKYPGHNLDRARNQIALAKDIKNKTEQLEDIIKKYL